MFGSGGGNVTDLPRLPRAVKTISFAVEQLSFRLLIAARAISSKRELILFDERTR